MISTQRIILAIYSKDATRMTEKYIPGDWESGWSSANSLTTSFALLSTTSNKSKKRKQHKLQLLNYLELLVQEVKMMNEMTATLYYKTFFVLQQNSSA